MALNWKFNCGIINLLVYCQFFNAPNVECSGWIHFCEFKGYYMILMYFYWVELML